MKFFVKKLGFLVKKPLLCRRYREYRFISQILTLYKLIFNTDSFGNLLLGKANAEIYNCKMRL